MAQAKTGDTVKVRYTGKFEDGTVFDSSEDGDVNCESGPLEFTIGAGNVIPGFEGAVIGMNVGDRKTVHIPVAQAYGPHLDEMVAEVARTDLPPGINLEVGLQLEVTQEDGETFPVLLTELTDTMVTLDANHPLAGRDLFFSIELVAIM